MARVQFRRDSKANWGIHNPILADGEIGIEKDTKRFKIGDGLTAWSSLSYSSKALADSPQEYIESLDIIGTAYNADGTIYTITYEFGHKCLFTYTSGVLTKAQYTDTDGVSVVLTVLYSYINGKLNSIIKE